MISPGKGLTATGRLGEEALLEGNGGRVGDERQDEEQRRQDEAVPDQRAAEGPSEALEEAGVVEGQ